MNHTLTNGLALLMHLAQSCRPHGVSELSEALSLPKSHVHRLLQTLLDSHYVVKDSRRRYRIGVGALRLGHSLLRDIPIRLSALPVMQRHVAAIGYPLTLALPFGAEAISVAHVSTDGDVRGTVETLGAVLGTCTSASGKLFLAHRPPDEQRTVLASLTFGASHAYASVEDLTRDLEAIVQQGHSLNRIQTSIRSVAVPIVVDDVPGAALGASCSSGIPESSIPTLIDALRQARDSIELQERSRL